MSLVRKSNKLLNVCYDIRGPVLDAAKRMEDEGHRITKLNIGNPAPFGFDAPEEIIQDIMLNLSHAQGYCDSKGLFSARKAIMQECQRKRIANVELEDIYLGNGVSELIVMAMQALINDGDEMLIPAPDYPLWTAAVSLAGGQPKHYRCDESQGWIPDIEHMRDSINERTRGIVVINPNNPTGAVYPKKVLEEILELARQHNLLVFADEIYDKILYDGATHTPMAELADDVLCVSFNGLSKTYRSAGFRAGWMVLSGSRKHQAKDYIEGLEILSNMRLCANVPAQYAIQTALGGYQSINDLTAPGGRLYEQRQCAYDLLTKIPGVSCVKPEGALYLFPKLDPEIIPIQDDQKMVLDLLLQERILLVQGSGFNQTDTQHFRLVFLPHLDELQESIERLAHFFKGYSQQY